MIQIFHTIQGAKVPRKQAISLRSSTRIIRQYSSLTFFQIVVFLQCWPQHLQPDLPCSLENWAVRLAMKRACAGQTFWVSQAISDKFKATSSHDVWWPFLNSQQPWTFVNIAVCSINPQFRYFGATLGKPLTIGPHVQNFHLDHTTWVDQRGFYNLHLAQKRIQAPNHSFSVNHAGQWKPESPWTHCTQLSCLWVYAMF